MLRGRVVLVEFWTYGCVNCQHVIPQLRVWHERYTQAGLTIVGVHAPEFLWERSYDRVVAAVKEARIRYPVVQDNDYTIWKRFGIRAWPTAVLIDRKGVLRYQHIGEGEYAEIESMIQGLLAERG
jgi:thiol-disulfide isomerase/thioredoxin